MKNLLKSMGWLVFCLVLAGSVALTSCRGQDSAPGANAAMSPAKTAVTLDQASQETTPISFRLKWLIYSAFGPHFVALEKGFYRDEKLNVTIQPGGPGMDPIKLVVTGAEDVGLASYDQILIAREKGIPVIAIGEDTVKSGVGFISAKNSGIAKPQDFVGKKVGIMPGTDKGTVYEALMAVCKIDRKKIIEIPVAFDIAVLLNGTIQVFPSFIVNQPIIAEEKGFPVNIIDPWDYGVRPGGNVYFTSEETLKNKRAALKRFLRAELRGIIESQRLTDEEVVDMVMKHNPALNRTAEIKIWKATKAILLEGDPAKVGIMPQEKWSHTADLFLKSGILKSTPKLEECYSNDLVMEIQREGGLIKTPAPGK